jgi:hypothetical protein
MVGMTRQNAVLPLILLAAFASFLKADVGTTGFEILGMPMNARSCALAGAETAVLDDVNACLTDPSWLSTVKGLELSVSGNIYMENGKAGAFSVVYPMPFGTFGFTGQFLRYGTVEFRSDDSEIPDSLFNPGASLYAVSFGGNFFGLFPFGMNVKYFTEILTGDLFLSGFAVDLSTHYKDFLVKGLTPVFAIRNLGSAGQSKIILPMNIVFGCQCLFELEFPFWGISDIRPSAEVRWERSERWDLGAGLELLYYHVGDLLDMTFRISFDWPADAGFLSGLHAGLGMQYRKITMDYALAYPGRMALVHSLSMTFKWEEPEQKRYIRNITEKKLEKTLDEIDKKFQKEKQKK